MLMIIIYILGYIVSEKNFQGLWKGFYYFKGKDEWIGLKFKP